MDESRQRIKGFCGAERPQMPLLNLPRGLWGFLHAAVCLQGNYARVGRDVKV